MVEIDFGLLSFRTTLVRHALQRRAGIVGWALAARESNLCLREWPKAQKSNPSNRWGCLFQRIRASCYWVTKNCQATATMANPAAANANPISTGFKTAAPPTRAGRPAGAAGRGAVGAPGLTPAAGAAGAAAGRAGAAAGGGGVAAGADAGAAEAPAGLGILIEGPPAGRGGRLIRTVCFFCDTSGAFAGSGFGFDGGFGGEVGVSSDITGLSCSDAKDVCKRCQPLCQSWRPISIFFGATASCRRAAQPC